MKEHISNTKNKSGFKRADLNFVIDAITLLLMLAMIITGIVIRYVLPPGTGGKEGGRALLVWGMNRHEWGDVHFWLAVSLVGIALLHVVLYWSWVCGVVRRWSTASSRNSCSLSKRTVYFSGAISFVFFAGLVIILYLLLQSNIVVRDGQGRSSHFLGSSGVNYKTDTDKGIGRGQGGLGRGLGYGRGRGGLGRGSGYGQEPKCAPNDLECNPIAKSDTPEKIHPSHETTRMIDREIRGYM
ncbi:MAG: DUF4405 domain-containing protein, partial [Pseudomonadota bacterium]